MGVTLGVGAASADEMWAVFEARCLVPYEHLVLPDTRGLTRDGDIWTGAAFPLTLAPGSCAVTGGMPDDLAIRLASRDEYVRVGAAIWQSTTWREPRIEVEALADGYLVRETDLES
ncbi:MAG: hypothetical protein AAF919_05505 [Pseudomonadota bacterium]